MTHNLAFRVVFPISAVLLLTSSMAAVRPPVRTSPCAAAAAQYLGQPIRSLDPGRIAGILEQAARQLSEGRLKAHLPPGHKLFTVCSESDDLAVAHVPPPGEDRDDAAEKHVKAMIGHVWEAARVLNVEEAFETDIPGSTTTHHPAAPRD